MSISSQTINQLKELPQGYPSLLMCQISLPSGQTLYTCSTTDGVNPFLTFTDGNQYSTRVLNQNISQLQSMSAQGIDVTGSFTLQLADADNYWLGYERDFGFRGSTLTVTLTIFDPATSTFSYDSSIIFTGLCDAGTWTQSGNKPVFSIASIGAYNTARRLLPDVPIQATCPWAINFPTTLAERTDALYNPFSLHFNCAYSPDLGPGFGNFQSGSTPFTSCSGSRTDCEARGMITTDYRGRNTNFFGASEWLPPDTWKGKNYESGKSVQGINSVNPQKLTQFVPESFGAGWLSGIPANVIGDPNSTRAEIMLCYGNLDNGGDIVGTGIKAVTENNILIPPNRGNFDLLLNWGVVSTGSRQGGINHGYGFDGHGDPYGSIATIVPIVYQQIQGSNGNPNVRALVGPRPLPTFPTADPSGWNYTRTDNPAWVILEICRRIGIPAAAFDLQSVIDFARHAAESIPYIDGYGNTAYHRRYGVSLNLLKQESAATLLNGLRVASKLMIVPNANGTKLRMVPRQTLWGQQPNPVAGSNYKYPIRSYKITDNPTDAQGNGLGYIAYSFDETNVQAGTLTMTQGTIAASPNILVANIQDEDNVWTADTVTLGDSTATALIGNQKVQSTITAIGLPNFDQAHRALQSKMFELFRANPRGDAGGTWQFAFQSTIRTQHLRQGDLVWFSWQTMELHQQLFRVIGCSPAMDYRTSQITLQWHDDRAYCDLYGQQTSPYYSQTGDIASTRPPYYWNANRVGNIAPDPVNALPINNYRTFDLQVGAAQMIDGTIVPEVIVTGEIPINQPFSTLAPRIPFEGTASLTGGTLPDNRLYYSWMSAMDANGNEGPLCRYPALIYVPLAGSHTVALTTPVTAWPRGTTGWRNYIGSTPQSPVLCNFGSGTPLSVTTTAGFETGAGPVDMRFDHFILRMKRLVSAGFMVAGPGLGGVNTVTFNTITFASASDLRTNILVNPAISDHLLDGYTLLAVWNGDGGSVPLITLQVSSQVGNTVTIDQSSGAIDLTTLALSQTWFLALHKLDAVSANTLHAANNSFISQSNLVGCQVRVLDGMGSDNQPRSIVAVSGNGTITLDQAFPSPIGITNVGNGAPTLVIIEESTWRVNLPQPGLLNSSSNATTTMQATFDNVGGLGWLVQVSSADATRVETILSQLSHRLFYWPGQVGSDAVQGLNLTPNPDFEGSPGVGEIVPSWFQTQNDQASWQVLIDSGYRYSGEQALHFHLNTQIPIPPGQALNCVISSRKNYPVPKPGQKYYMALVGAATIVGATLPPLVSALWYGRLVVYYSDGTRDITTASYTANPVVTPWTQTTNRFVVDPNKIPTLMTVDVAVVLANNDIYYYIAPPSLALDLWIDHLLFQEVVSLDTGQLEGFTTKHLSGQGSIIPAEGIAIAVTNNTNDGAGNCTIGLSWVATSLLGASGATVSVAAGSATWTGLSASTQYHFYAYVLALDGTVHFGSGDPPTSPPAGPSASAAMNGSLDGRYPQQSFIVTTLATAGSGGGSGSDPGICPDGDELVFLQEKGIVAVKTAVLGDLIRGKDFVTGAIVYRRIVHVHAKPSSRWYRVQGRRVTPCDLISLPDQRKWEFAFRFEGAVFEPGQGSRVHLRLEDRVHDEQNYLLYDEDGKEALIVHNDYVNPC